MNARRRMRTLLRLRELFNHGSSSVGRNEDLLTAFLSESEPTNIPTENSEQRQLDEDSAESSDEEPLIMESEEEEGRSILAQNESLERLYEMVNYEGWERALPNDLLTMIPDVEHIVNMLQSLTDGERIYINEKPTERARRLLLTMQQRPDQAWEFREALRNERVIAVRKLDENIRLLDSRCFRRPTSESLRIVDDALAFQEVIEENQSRINHIQYWGADLLCTKGVIVRRELESFSDRSQRKSGHLCTLLSSRTTKQRQLFLEFLDTFKFNELRYRIMAGPQNRQDTLMNTGSIPYHFIRRKKYSKRLKIILQEKWRHENRERKPFWIILHGPNGVGKSTAAADVVRQVNEYLRFSKVLWINDCNNLDEVLHTILLKLSGGVYESDYLNHINDQLRLRENGRVLLVLDGLINVQIAQMLQMFRFVIITTSFKNITAKCHNICSESMEIHQFNRKYCKRLLKEIINPETYERTEDSLLEACIDICRDCEFSPYAITQIGRKINEPGGYLENNDFLVSLRRQYANYSANEVQWIKDSDIHPGFKIARDHLGDEEKNQFDKLVVFRSQTILPITMATIWGVDLHKARDLLELFYDCNLLQKNIFINSGNGSTQGYTLNNVQRYSLLRCCRHDDNNGSLIRIINSVVQSYKNKQLQFITNQDHFYFGNFVFLCLLIGDYETAQRTISNFQFLSRRLQINAGEHILSEFCEIYEGLQGRNVSKYFHEMWYLADLVVPQILQLNCPSLWRKVAVLQEPGIACARELETIDASTVSGDYRLWGFDHPRTTSRTWMPNDLKRKLKVEGEGFTDMSFATSIDVSDDEKWIVIGCNNGLLYLFFRQTYVCVHSRDLGSYIFFVQFTDNNQFIVVTNTSFNLYRIAHKLGQWEVEIPEGYTQGISISHNRRFTDSSVNTESNLFQPIAANDTYLWIVCDNVINCFKLKPLTRNNQAEYNEINQKDMRYRHAEVGNSKDDRLQAFVTVTDGESITVLKYDSETENIKLFFKWEIPNCCVAILMDELLLYSVENRVRICKWRTCSNGPTPPIREVTLKDTPNITRIIPYRRQLVFGTFRKSLTIFDLNQKIEETIQTARPQAITVTSAKGGEAYNVYICSDGGWISKSMLTGKLLKRTINCCVPRDMANTEYIEKRLFKINIRKQQSHEKAEVLQIHWLERENDFLSIEVTTKRNDKFLSLKLIRRGKSLIKPHRRPKQEFDDSGELRCLFDMDKIIIYNKTLILQFLFDGETNGLSLTKLPSIASQEFDRIVVFGRESYLAALTTNGNISKFDGQQWSNKGYVVEDTCIDFKGLKMSNHIIGLFQNGESYCIQVVDVDNESIIRNIEDVCPRVLIQVSLEETFLGVGHPKKNEVTIYRLPICDDENRKVLQVPNVNSITFHPTQQHTIYITHVDEGSRKLFLKIWQFMAADEDNEEQQQQAALRDICIHSFCDLTSIFVDPRYQISTMFISKRYYLIVTEKVIIRVDSNQKNRNDHSQLALDVSWIGESFNIKQCILGNDGQYLTLLTTNGNIYTFKAKDTVG